MSSSLIDELAAMRAGGIRMPEVAIRTMKPPPALPARNHKFFYDTPDASIRGDGSGPTDHLEAAESAENFAYGEANRLGTQAGYLNAPHVAQKKMCPLVLPNAKAGSYGNGPFALPFPHLRKGDIAFYLRLQSQWEMQRVGSDRHPGSVTCVSHGSQGFGATPLAMVCRDWRDVKRCKVDAAMNKSGEVFGNLQMVNYILHGIQHYRDSEPSWRDSFWLGFGLHRLDPRISAKACSVGASLEAVGKALRSE